MRSTYLLTALMLAVPAAATEPDHVSMSLDEFLDMYEKARVRPKDPGVAPFDVTLSAVAFDGVVQTDTNGEPETVVFDTKLRIDRHKADGWSRVPLLSAEAALIEATIDGRPAPLLQADGYYTMVTNRTGSFDVRLRFAVPVTSEQGTSSFALPLVTAGATTLRLTIPTIESIDLTVARARILSDQTIGGKRVIDAALSGSDRLAVRWQREVKTDQAAQEQARVYAEVQTLVGVGDGLLRATTTISHAILFAGVDTFRYDVPDGMTVLDVRGAGLRDWSIGPDGVLTAKLAYAADAAWGVTFDLEQMIGEGNRNIQAPLIVPLGVERSKGWVGVTSGGNLEIAAGDVKGAAPVDVRTLPATILGVTNQPVLLGYKYLGTDAKIPLVVTQHEEVDVLVTLLDQAQATTMFTEDGRRLTRVTYQVRNNRKQYLRVALPGGAELWSAAVAGRAVQPAKASDGAILMPLIRSSSNGGALSSFEVEVVYVESMDTPAANGRGHFEADLPIVDVPTTYVAWTIYAPSRAKISGKSFDGSIRNVGWLSQPLGAMQTMVVQQSIGDMQGAANAAVDAGALGSGAAPVRVELPLEGQAIYFEKLLVLEERVWAGFDYAGLKP